MICSFREPPQDRECRAAIWSWGRSCRTCRVECYRRGWTHRRVEMDNDRLCRDLDLPKRRGVIQ
jgi:hypothetical protein